MLGWLFREDPIDRLRKEYQAKVAEAEFALNKKGDRMRHSELLTEAEEIGKELDALVVQQAS